MKVILSVLLTAALLCTCAFAAPAATGSDGSMEPPMIFVTPSSEQLEIVGEVVSTAVESTATEVSIEPTPSASPEPLPLAGRAIGIDPGHQEHANSELEPNSPYTNEKKQKVLSGTAGVRTGIPEYVTDLEISLLLRDALEEQGATVYMTRETNDVDISNMERALMFNELHVDLALRIHCNGVADSSVHGAGSYVRKTGDKQQESEEAGEVILDAICEASGARRQGVFRRDTYTGQNWSTVPCVMLELGYLTNPEEDEKLNDPEYQKLLVQGIVEGVRRYFDPGYAQELTLVLREGKRGEPVELLQQRLIELGYMEGEADGIYGPATAAAVRAFQEAAGLAANGVADAATQELLFDE